MSPEDLASQANASGSQDFLARVAGFFTQNIVLGEAEFPFSLLSFLLWFVVPMALVIFVGQIIQFFVKKSLKTAEVSEENSKKTISVIRLILRIISVGLGILLFIRLFGGEFLQSLGGITEVLTTPFYSAGGTDISLITLILLIPIFYIASWLGKISKKLMDEHFLTRVRIDEGKKFGVSSFTKYLVIVISLLVGLSTIGINLSSLAVIFSVLGIGLGFGLQNTVANLFAGLVMIFTQPIKENDFISHENFIGTVQKVNLLSTILLTPLNETLIIPNSELVNMVVHNHTYADRWVIQIIPIGVHYKSDLNLVEKVLFEIGKENPYALASKDPIVWIMEYGASSINLELRIWIRDRVVKPDSLSWTNKKIWERFKEKGIEIPYQQIDLNFPQNGEDTPRPSRNAESRPK